jgi:hypothetical protein
MKIGLAEQDDAGRGRKTRSGSTLALFLRRGGKAHPGPPQGRHRHPEDQSDAGPRSGWQRIGLIASVIWMLGGTAMGNLGKALAGLHQPIARQCPCLT